MAERIERQPARRTRRQLERCELARRENIFRGLNCVHLRCDYVGNGTEEDMFRPRGSEHVTAWEQVADMRAEIHGHRRENAQIIRLPGIRDRRDIPADVLRRGVEVLEPDFGGLREVVRMTDKDAPAVAALLRKDNLDLGDFDWLVPPLHERATGHFSVAHNSGHNYYNFDTAYDPFGNAPEWTPYKDPAFDYYESTGGKFQGKAPGGSTRSARFRYDSSPMANVTADYSVEADLFCSEDGSGRDRNLAICGRFADASNFYGLWIHNGDVLALYEVTSGGGFHELGNYNMTDGSALVRLEMVGTAMKGYEDGNERVSATDGSLSNAEYPAIHAYQTANASGAAPTLDNFKIYRTAGVRRRRMENY